MASGSLNGTIRFWSLDEKGFQKRTNYKAHDNSVVEEVKWNPQKENILASVSSDSIMKIWDIRIGKKELIAKKTKGYNLGLKWNPTGKTIAINLLQQSKQDKNNQDNIVSFFDFRKMDWIKHMMFKTEINDLSWDPTDSVLFICTSGPE